MPMNFSYGLGIKNACIGNQGYEASMCLLLCRACQTLAQIHEVFKDYVMERRGDKIKRECMNGDYFVGKKALEVGLIDQIGTAQHVLPERFGKGVTLNLVNPRRMVWPWSFGQDSQSGLVSSILDNIQDRMEEQMLRSRYGL